MKYFFILGNNPALSVAEISAVFDVAEKKNGELIREDVFILTMDEKIKAKELIKRMGGVIKIGVVEEILDKSDNLEQAVQKILANEPKNGKFYFGFSNYGLPKLNIKKLGMETKKYLRAKNISCRWVISKDKTLSSVVVEQNKLLSNGAEIIFFALDNKIVVGRTLAVQPFKELSSRDYGRPARDDYSGMIPPKLAQIMLNLARAKAEDIILDPFCGSGTILMEGLLAGYKNLIGADLSAKAIDDSKKNLDWIVEKNKLAKPNIKLYKVDAAKISTAITKNSIDCIVTEPYLGPQRGLSDIKKTARDLADLYSRALDEFAKILKPQGRVVIIFPVFFNKEYISPNLKKYNIINPLPTDLASNPLLQITTRNSIIYGRPGQKVWREIVILKFK